MFTRSMFQTPDIIRQHAILDRVAALIDRGVLKTTLSEDFGPISAANMRRTHALVEGGRSHGKVVLTGF